MNRRQWLAAAGASAGFFGLGELTRGSAGCRAAGDTLSGARERARRAGKPLLVIPIPTDRVLGRRLGLLWGQMFAMGANRELADLALCELACVPVEELVRGQDDVAPTDLRASVAVLIETDGTRPARSRVEAADLLPPEHCGLSGAEADDAAVRERCAALGQRLRAVIVPDESALERRIRQVGSRSPGEAMQRTFFAPKVRPRLASLDRIAAMYHPLRETHADDSAREYWAGMLAQAVLLRLWEQDPVGARWQVTELEPCPPCGMAFVPDSSRNFLDFYTS